MGALEYLGYISADAEEEDPLRHLFVLPLDDDPWPAPLELPTWQFALFLASDARCIPDQRFESIATACFRGGVRLVSTWGPDCERAHDIFDKVQMELNPDLDPPFVMTSWHANESLDSALSSFLFIFSCDFYEGETPAPRSCVVCSISNEFTAQIQASLKDLQGLWDRSMVEFIASLPPHHELRTEDDEPYVVDFVPADGTPPPPRTPH